MNEISLLTLPLLPCDLIDPGTLFQSNIADQSYGDFSLSDFFLRYAAGDESLKALRTVSRKQLALMTSGVGYAPPNVVQLQSLINRFQRATAAFNQPTLALDNLNQVIQILEANDNAAIRTSQNWIGPSLAKATRVPPAPELLNPYLENWLEFINSPNITPIQKAVAGYCQLVYIHPFSDGNGRAARALMACHLASAKGIVVNPALYRLVTDRDQFISAISAFGIESDQGFDHNYWQQAFAWSERLKQRCYECLAEAKKQLSAKLAITPLSPEAVQLLNYLWQQPTVCETGLSKTLSPDRALCRRVISELVKCQVLHPHRLRHPAGAVIFECPEIFAAWAKMDEAIYQ